MSTVDEKEERLVLRADRLEQAVPIIVPPPITSVPKMELIRQKVIGMLKKGPCWSMALMYFEIGKYDMAVMYFDIGQYDVHALLLYLVQLVLSLLSFILLALKTDLTFCVVEGISDPRPALHLQVVQ